jgi:branched-subunit amino acid aminotransferase/4-amino-4-deoxychorismate lyase
MGHADPHAGASLASVDGEIMLAAEARIPATDDGLLRGDGVFEVIRVYDGVPFAFEEHLVRLERSAQSLRLGLDLETVRAEAHRLLARAGAGPAHEALRIVLTRGGRRLLLTEALHELPDRIRLKSVTYSPTRVLDEVKSLSYAANMLSRRLAQENGYDDALLVTPHGRVLEAPTSSVFWVSDGQILTPPLSEHILASITRRIVIEVTEAQERECTLPELCAADEAFLASTVREVHPVAALDGREWPSVGPVTARAAAAVNEHIHLLLARA